MTQYFVYLSVLEVLFINWEHPVRHQSLRKWMSIAKITTKDHQPSEICVMAFWKASLKKVSFKFIDEGGCSCL